MKEIKTFMHLDTTPRSEEEIEEIYGQLQKARWDLALKLKDKYLHSQEYKDLLEINKILNVKMIQMSEEEKNLELENALKEITERDFEEIAQSINDEDKYIELLKGYKGYKNEWKLYTRTNVNSFKYYFHKAKFILRSYYDDYQYCINLQFRGHEKLLDPYMKQHYDLMKNKKRLNKMTQEEFEFRLENVRLLENAWIDPELSQYSMLINLFSFSGLSEEQLSTMCELNRGSIENDVKKLYTALAHVLERRDKNYICGKEFLEQRKLAEENVEKKELIEYIGMLEERVQVLKKFEIKDKKKK
ncbi:MAG: hypothetical protein MR904_00845 [Clostridia bacterium]|nr:hypothetical protein [Clostridia bacterium]